MSADWMTPFAGSGIEWHESLPSPYTYQESDFCKLVAAVHEYEAALLDARTAELESRQNELPMARAYVERDRLRRVIRHVIEASPGTPDSVKKYLVRELEGSWGDPYEQSYLDSLPSGEKKPQ